MDGKDQLEQKALVIDSAIRSRLSSSGRPGANAADDEPFFIADLGEILRQHRRWISNLPGVQPFYAVKCNPDPALLKTLHSLGVGFDCASISELRTVLGLGVNPSKIIFANPCKPASALAFAREAGVSLMSFDNLDELGTIKQYHPDAVLVLRIFASDGDALIDFSAKFGASMESTVPLLVRARELGLRVCGVSFHVGTGASSANAYVKAIQHAKTVFEQGKNLGHDMNTLDIGGGFQDTNFEDITGPIRTALVESFPSDVRVIAEPGRYYTRTAYTLVCKVISRRCQPDTTLSGQPDMLYQNDGIYGCFMDLLFYKIPINPTLVVASGIDTNRSPGEHRYSIWGPTCDSIDCITRDVSIQSEVKVGDFLKYPNMGAYTSATATRFNGFPNRRHTIYVNSELASHGEKNGRGSLFEYNNDGSFIGGRRCRL